MESTLQQKHTGVCFKKEGSKCDSTNVATGISEHHSTFTGVLFSVSCCQTNTLQTSIIYMLILRTSSVMWVISRNITLEVIVCVQLMLGLKPSIKAIFIGYDPFYEFKVVALALNVKERQEQLCLLSLNQRWRASQPP